MCGKVIAGNSPCPELPRLCACMCVWRWGLERVTAPAQGASAVGTAVMAGNSPAPRKLVTYLSQHRQEPAGRWPSAPAAVTRCQRASSKQGGSYSPQTRTPLLAPGGPQPGDAAPQGTPGSYSQSRSPGRHFPGSGYRSNAELKRSPLQASRASHAQWRSEASALSLPSVPLIKCGEGPTGAAREFPQHQC